MNTYFISPHDVRAYVDDFLERLNTITPLPEVWCPVTDSGDGLLFEVLQAVRSKYPEWLKTVQILPMGLNDQGDNIQFIKLDPVATIGGKSVLLLDGAIHSGRMMAMCCEAVQRYQPAEVTSYALVIKRCSTFIPSIWALMIEEVDRAYFLLSKIPNNRLEAGGGKPQLPIHFQRLSERHFSRPVPISGVPSIDRLTWEDRHFQMETSGFRICTYVLERGDKTIGFLTVHPLEDKGLSIDEVVVDKSFLGSGYGGVLLRFADTLARQSKCEFSQLYAIENKVGLYQKFKYSVLEGRPPIKLGNENYRLMSRTILYHQQRRSKQAH